MRLFASVLLIAPSVAWAQATPPSPVKPAPEKKICHVENDTGSILQKRTCRTKAEWAAIAAMDTKNTENFQNRRPTNIPNSGL